MILVLMIIGSNIEAVFLIGAVAVWSILMDCNPSLVVDLHLRFVLGLQTRSKLNFERFVIIIGHVLQQILGKGRIHKRLFWWFLP